MAEILFDLMICFKIETNDEIDTITNILNINPTDYILKGVSRSVVLEPAEKNVWMYDKKYRNCNSIETLLQNFFEDIPNLFNKIGELRAYGEISIRLSIISDFAQIGFTLSEKDIKYLNCLNIPVEISIFSWGGCIE